MNKLLVITISCLFVAGFSATAKAVVLNPGGSVTPTGASLKGASTDVTNLTPTNFSGGAGDPSLSGTVYEDVFSNSTGLLFDYTFKNTGSNGDVIDLMSSASFAGFTTNVDASTPGVLGATGILPSLITSNATGSVLDFYFTGDNGVSVGSSSDSLWVQTNATNYTLSSVGFEDTNGTFVSILDYAPVAGTPLPADNSATPEPSTMVMFGMGALGLVGLRKRKLA